MRVFLAGATGAIGRPLVAHLVAQGHAVVGTTRSPERARALEAAGAEAVVLDAFDSGALHAAVVAARPDAVVHQLTALSAPLRPRHYADWLATTNRLRAEVTPVLLDAARAAGARRFVAQSVSFVLALEGPMVGDERAKDARDAPEPFGTVVRAVVAMEAAVTGADGLEGMVLRYGYFWGPGTSIGVGGQQAEEVCKRRLPVIGTGEGRFSLVHVEDAARATVLALEHGAPGVYNVVDDEPARQREWVPALATALGAPAPRHVPTWVARLVAGSFFPLLAEQQRGSSNAKARAELSWTPEHASWRDAFGVPGALG